MVRSFFIPLLIAAPLFLASAQQDPKDRKTTTDPTAKPAATQPATKAQAKTPVLKGFIDKNNDGIDDRKQDGKNCDGKGLRRRNRMRDNFIDADGDGINDNRCSGTGLQRRACKGGKGCGN